MRKQLQAHTNNVHSSEYSMRHLRPTEQLKSLHFSLFGKLNPLNNLIFVAVVDMSIQMYSVPDRRIGFLQALKVLKMLQRDKREKKSSAEVLPYGAVIMQDIFMLRGAYKTGVPKM